MRRFVFLVVVFMLLFIVSCKTFETVNGKKYFVKRERINDGNLFTLILNMAVLYNPGSHKPFISYVESAKKLGHEKKNDPNYIFSKIEVGKEDRYLVLKRYHINGYDKISGVDSIYKYFKIIHQDSVQLQTILNYRKGLVVRKDEFK